MVDKDNLFENLVKWFEFDSVCSKDDVLKLILRLIKVSTYGFVLIASILRSLQIIIVGYTVSFLKCKYRPSLLFATRCSSRD